MSKEKTEQLILEIEKKQTIFFDKFRHDCRKEKRRVKAIAASGAETLFEQEGRRQKI